jgi:hypothetical protein
MTKPLVVIASPYQGDVVRNIEYARRATLDSVRRGELPVASHLLYPQILQDHIEEERTIGLALGVELVLRSDLLAVYTDLGITPGMEAEIAVAHSTDVEISYRSLGP